MIRSPEYIQPSEMIATHTEHATEPESRLAPSRLEEIFRMRERMLASIESFVALPLLDAIRSKLAYERSKLIAIAEADEKRAAEKKRMSARLRSEYFVLKPLEVDLL